MTVQRPLRGFELIFAQIHDVMGPDLHVVGLDGEVELDAVRASVHRLLCRYPALRAGIRWPDGPGTRPVFEFPDPTPDAVDVADLDAAAVGGDPDRPLWQRAVEAETRRGFETEQGFMFRVRRVQDDGRTWLLLAAHHSCVDGNAMARIVHDLVEGCAIGVEEEEVVPGPSLCLFDRIAAPAWKGWLLPIAVWMAARKRQAFLRDCPYSWVEPTPEQDVDCVQSFHIGNPDALPAVVARCRQEGVTVGAAYSAAVQFAFLRCLQEWGGQLPWRGRKLHLELEMSYDLRQRVTPPVERNAVAMLVSTADVGVKVAPETGFWELARRLGAELQRQARIGRPVDTQILLDGLTDLDATFAKYDLDYTRTAGAAALIGVSNVGRYPFAHEAGDLRIHTWFGLNRAMWGAASSICWLRSIDGRLMYNAAGLAPLLGRARVDALMGEVARVMEGCGGADAGWTLGAQLG